MSDNGSILGAIADAGKDLVKETGVQTAKATVGIVKGAAQQIVGTAEEVEAQKKADKMATHQRIQQIEAEMAQIRSAEGQRHQMQTSQNPTTPSHLQSMEKRESKKPDEASRQAVGRAEQGRNFKG